MSSMQVEIKEAGENRAVLVIKEAVRELGAQRREALGTKDTVGGGAMVGSRDQGGRATVLQHMKTKPVTKPAAKLGQTM